MMAWWKWVLIVIAGLFVLPPMIGAIVGGISAAIPVRASANPQRVTVQALFADGSTYRGQTVIVEGELAFFEPQVQAQMEEGNGAVAIALFSGNLSHVDIDATGALAQTLLSDYPGEYLKVEGVVREGTGLLYVAATQITTLG